MTDRKSYRARITAAETVTVPVGRGLIDLKPGWTGPVVPAVAVWLQEHGGAEVWQDGEPPAPGAPAGQSTETAVRIIQTPDGPTFEDIEPPPLPETEPDTEAGLEGEGA